MFLHIMLRSVHETSVDWWTLPSWYRCGIGLLYRAIIHPGALSNASPGSYGRHERGRNNFGTGNRIRHWCRLRENARRMALDGWLGSCSSRYSISVSAVPSGEPYVYPTFGLV